MRTDAQLGVHTWHILFPITFIVPGLGELVKVEQDATPKAKRKAS